MGNEDLAGAIPGQKHNNPPDARLSASDSSFFSVFARFRKNRAAIVGFIIFALICLACVMAPYLTKWKFNEIIIADRMTPPSQKHILGTDYLGRDLFTRLLYGGRVTLRVALVSTVLAAVIGGAAGLAAGYHGGGVDFIISPVLDVLASIPIILLVIVFEAVFGFGRGYFMYAMVVAGIPQFARLVRACVMNIMGNTYIEAARALGVGHVSVILRHVLHNISSPLIVRFTSGVSEALLTCTILGYLEIGIRPPNPEWGAIVHSAKGSIRTHPYMMIISCAVIVACVISLNLFGDGLRDALDPKE